MHLQECRIVFKGESEIVRVRELELERVKLTNVDVLKKSMFYRIDRYRNRDRQRKRKGERKGGSAAVRVGVGVVRVRGRGGGCAAVKVGAVRVRRCVLTGEPLGSTRERA